jgi:hypothetical protein
VACHLSLKNSDWDLVGFSSFSWQSAHQAHS